MNTTTLALLLGLCAGAAFAQAEFAPAPPPPPMPERSQPEGERPSPETLEREEALEPQVRIIEEDGARVEEYSVQGRLLYVRITPANGYPYYLFDTDGDGSLDRRANNLENPPINWWILHRW